MYYNKKSIICFFLALIIFFYGCYHTAIETDYIGEVKMLANSIALFNTSENVIAEEKIAAEEILNTYGLSVEQNILHQFKLARKFVRISWSFLVIQIFIFSILKIFVAICLMEVPKPHRNMAVLQYIHNIDGKK